MRAHHSLQQVASSHSRNSHNLWTASGLIPPQPWLHISHLNPNSGLR